MIVQCEHCQTKYRIADDKVKGKGVKVRCAKCENVFTVAPVEADLPVSTRHTPATPPDPPPPHPREEPPSREIGEAGPGDASLQGEPPPGEAVPPPEPPISGSPETAGDRPAANGDTQPEKAFPPDPDPNHYQPPSPGEGALDFGSPRPAHEMDRGGSGPSDKPSHPDETAQEGGFEIEGTMREETPFESGPSAGDNGVVPEPTEQASGGDWGNISIDTSTAADTPDSGFGLADSPVYEPPSPAPVEEPLEDDLADPFGGPSPGTSTTSLSQPAARTTSGGKRGLLLILLLAIVGGGGYLAYPKVLEIIQSRTQQPSGALTPADVQVKALSRNDGKIIYSVRGDVRNESGGNVGMIQVEAQFRNASGDVLSKAAAYCGNVFADNELVSLDLNQIRSDLQNELGQSLSNANIAPGQTVPFLVVLENPPSGINKVTVTISSFKETT